MEEEKVTIKDLTGVLKLSAFLERYTDINPKGGIYNRINGKATGKLSKTKELTAKDKIAIRKGLQELSDEINLVIGDLTTEEDDQIQS